jgi:hypothetical protein
MGICRDLGRDDILDPSRASQGRHGAPMQSPVPRLQFGVSIAGVRRDWSWRLSSPGYLATKIDLILAPPVVDDPRGGLKSIPII